MANKKILNMRKGITRAQFEKQLGGQFEAVPEMQGRRANQGWATFKAPSERVQGRIDCFARRLVEGGHTYAGPNWGAVARVMGI